MLRRHKLIFKTFISIWVVLSFSLTFCTSPNNQKPAKSDLKKETNQFDISDIQTSYFGPLVDTILNHSKFNFHHVQKDDVSFYFEMDSFFAKQIPNLINDALVSKRHCENLLGGKIIPHTLRIIYFNDREKLRPYLNMAPKGYALPDVYTLLIVSNDSIRAYHTHELMDIISTWKFGGYASPPTDWIQEGLSVFADNPCMNYPIHSIAANLLYSNRHTTFDSIFYYFRALSDITGYLQAGSLVQYFIEKYGIEHFSILWQRGIKDIQQIINVSSDVFEKEYYTFLKKAYKQKTEINWDLLNNKGCG